VEISVATARRFLLGKQGLWPGRRWRGLDGAETAIHAMRELQLDPLVLVARAQDHILQARVLDYEQDGWAVLTYEQRRFFDWGGWLAIRPMDELPYWRVLMRRERSQAHWQEVAAEHAGAIAEMRSALRERDTVANRDFETGDRKQVTSYRGRKDSALALHYLWRIGEAMVTRRERFERVYALTERVAPAHFIREASDAEADDYMLMKMIDGAGLGRFTSVSLWLLRTVLPAELNAWRERKLADGALIEVRVEGWRRPLLALGSDAAALTDLEGGRIPASWAPLETTTHEEVTFLAPLDPVSARGRATALFDFEYTWEIYTPVHKRRWGAYTMPILWGDTLVARIDPRLDRATRTLVITGLWLEDQDLAADEAFGEALARAMTRLLAFLGAERIDVSAVPQRLLRQRLKAIPQARRTARARAKKARA
jgi:uncharacterized protein